MEHHNRGTFKGSFGFVLAAAGSAVGLGNIWRFPYLAARDGGGLFLVIYIILALTFGFAMLTSEVSIGRKTKQSPLTAYGKTSDATYCPNKPVVTANPPAAVARTMGSRYMYVPKYPADSAHAFSYSDGAGRISPGSIAYTGFVDI